MDLLNWYKFYSLCTSQLFVAMVTEFRVITGPLLSLLCVGVIVGWGCDDMKLPFI